MSQISLSKSFLETLQTCAAIFTLSSISIPLGITISILAIYCLIQQNKQTTKEKRFQGEGIIEETIFPHQNGRISFKGSCWFAYCPLNLTLFPGERVKVVGRKNLTLIVLPK